jgi:16S rRNA (guanine(966)-N(2))-methyltransferase RsmD
MRVIAGTRKGHFLVAPRGLGTRPTSDRIRTIMFDILGGRVSGAVGVDLFAGSGALGIEALSRGAAQMDFVEKSRRIAEIIQRNLNHTHLEDHARVMVADAFAFLNRAGAAENGLVYDLLLADPPYGQGGGERLLRALTHSRLLRPGAVVVIEESAHLELALGPSLIESAETNQGRLRCFLRRVVGDTALHFYEAS